jgi:hypothetical protein
MHLACGANLDFEPESPFSVPVPGNCIAPEADCKAKRTFAAEKPDDLLPSWTGPRHREASKLISPTPVTPPSFRHWDYAQRRLSASLPEAATAPSCATSRRTVLSSGVLPPTAAIDKGEGLVKGRIFRPVFVTPRVGQRRLRTKTPESHAESPLGERIAPPTIDAVQHCGHDSSMRTSSRRAGAEVENATCVFQGGPCPPSSAPASLDARVPNQ